ncbi:MucB/RseB C-terminal domain-containing protein [Idiomarina seosinensis]|uniref:Negative regulator of sigma E activity n=1 Tax=Idiomarina seosinensis TaxID=281739 RepID=A0A432ZJB0_9GAMM|nr:MucB/RseB C-terminal domain-containing protein [Idiomarina seosinensis]RUO77362.1 negative regulator of sigma E activity [Idiomarina seosinensis]
MQRLTSWLAVLLLFVSAAASAQTQLSETEEGERWFNLMADALNELNFEASFVHVQGDRIEPYQWVHGVDENGRQFEWLSQMNGPGFRALRIDDVVSHFHPAATSYSLNSNAVSTLIPSAFNQPFVNVSKYYRAVAVGGARILDRKAQHIRLVSRDNQRYGFSIWVDRDNGMPLKVLMVNREGEVMEQLQLTNLSVRPVANEMVNELGKIERPPMLDKLQPHQPPRLDVAPNWSPAGFKLLKKQHHRLVIDGTPVDHYLYSDGLAEYSVYLTDDSEQQHQANISFTGPQTLYSQHNAQIMVTVVGQIPIEVAKQIASSVQ